MPRQIDISSVVFWLKLVACLYGTLAAIWLVNASRLHGRAAGRLGRWQSLRAVFSATLPEPLAAEARLHNLMEDAWFSARGQIVALVLAGITSLLWLGKLAGKSGGVVDAVFLVGLSITGLWFAHIAGQLRRLAPQPISFARAALLATMWDAPQPLSASAAFQAALKRAHFTMLALVMMVGVASFIQQAATVWPWRAARPG